MAEPTRGLLDTSVVVDHDMIDATLLPDETAIAAVTLAELAAGPHATDDAAEKARRQDRLQWAAGTWNPLPFDAEAARAYGLVFAATRAAGRSGRRRLADLLIASTAVANGLALYTRTRRTSRGWSRSSRWSGFDAEGRGRTLDCVPRQGSPHRAAPGPLAFLMPMHRPVFRVGAPLRYKASGTGANKPSPC